MRPIFFYFPFPYSYSHAEFTRHRHHISLYFPPFLNWSKCLCARCGFFSSSDRQKAIPYSIQFFPLSEQKRKENVYTLMSCFEGCARAQTHKRSLVFSLKKVDEGARIFPLVSSAATNASISSFLHSKGKKGKNYRHEKTIEKSPFSSAPSD